MNSNMIMKLAEVPIKSTASMSDQDRISGTACMIADLKMLADKDGCIAAAWALEVLEKIATAPES